MEEQNILFLGPDSNQWSPDTSKSNFVCLCGCETSYLIWREERRWWVVENRVQPRTFEHKRQNNRRMEKKLHDRKLHNTYYSHVCPSVTSFKFCYGYTGTTWQILVKIGINIMQGKTSPQRHCDSNSKKSGVVLIYEVGETSTSSNVARQVCVAIELQNASQLSLREDFLI
jgi:hypothetical protein